MYPLGHVGTAAVLAVLFSLSIVFVVVGVLLPDIIDKSLSFLGLLPCGRSLGHNIFFGPIVAGITYAVTRNKKYSLAILMGAYLHLAEDLNGFMPWLYPLVVYEFDCGPLQISPDYYSIIFELVGLVMIMAVWRYRKKIIILREKILRKLGR